MRLRRVAGAQEKLDAHPHILIANPSQHKGNWHKLFGNNNPIHIEIGMGKGQFLSGMAAAHPKINFIGIELFESVMVRALEKFVTDPRKNVILLKENAMMLSEYFAHGEIARLYLNFSDPWPKKRHAKRRLTHESFLKVYESLLTPDGTVWFKTDNRSLFEFSLVSMNNYGMHFDEISLDLHAEEPEFNIRTEYEENWSARGYPIYRIEGHFKRRGE